MIFDNIEFSNAEEIEKTESGYLPRRIRKEWRDRISPGIQNNKFGTGIELRFKMPDGACDITLRSEKMAEASVACIYFGSFQGGWEYSTKVIYDQPTKIHIEYPEGMERLRQISVSENMGFSPEVVRIVLPYTDCYYLGVEGNVIPPAEKDKPQKTYLAYGSSITHGSLGLLQPYSYPFRIAQKLKTDYLNMGFAGCALMEENMARYIVSRNDWDFASVEMGINAIGDKHGMSDEEFEHRIDVFTSILANDKRPVFATSIFQFNGEGQEKGKLYREIVKKYAQDRLIFVDGLELLSESSYISADLTHPTLEGMEQIASGWSQFMKEYEERINI